MSEILSSSDPNTEPATANEPDEFKTAVNRARQLMRSLITGHEPIDEEVEELHAMPRDVLIEAASRGIIRYYGPYGTSQRLMGGSVNEKRNELLDMEKSFALGLLAPEEEALAVAKANDWLDENFAD